MIAVSLKQTVRALRRAPAFATTSIVSIGLGVGMACTVFVLVQASVFATSPYPRADRLVEIWPTLEPGSDQPVDYLTVRRTLDWIGTDFRFVEGFAARGVAGPLILRRTDEAVRVPSEPIVGDWFGTLGAEALRGRTLGPGDLVAGAPPAAVVSQALWRDRLGASSDVPGGTLVLSGIAYTVVGVMPSGFDGEEKVWVAAGSLPEGLRPVAYGGVARLREGATVEDAARELAQLAAAQVAEDPAPYAGHGATARAMGDFGGGPSPTLWLLLGVTGAVLLVGLSNLTHLFLVRAQRRSASLAIRMSLGAGTGQLGAGLLAEALVVAIAGCALGLVLAWWGPSVLGSLMPELAAPGDPCPGAGALGLALVLAAAIAALVGLEPLRRLSTLDLRALLQRGSGGALATPGERRTRDLLVATQVAVSVVLLTGATILGLAWRTLGGLDVGYDADRVVLARPDWELVGTSDADQWALGRAVAERLGRRPEVAGVIAWSQISEDYPPRPEFDPVSDGPQPDLDLGRGPGATLEVEPGTIEALGIPLLRGRAISAEDVAGTPPVVVISRSGAERWWPGEDPLGHQMKLGQEGTWLTVVGVVEDFEPLNPLGRSTVTRAWRPFGVFTAARQELPVPPGWHALANCAGCDGVVIGVRASGRTAAAAAALRQEISGVDADLPMRTLETLFASQMSGYLRANILVPGRLIGLGVAVALALALLGLVGIVAEGVARRTREIGIRVALGASAPRLLRTVALESVLTSAAGLTVGLVVAVLVHRAMAGTLFNYMALRVGADTLEPSLVVALGAGVLTLSVAITTLTARRALTVDPVEALRAD